MIAGRHIVLLVGSALSAESRAEIESLGALIIDIGLRDPALVVRHLSHALRHPMPVPNRALASRIKPGSDRERREIPRGHR